MSLEQRLEGVHQRLRSACAEAGRDPKDVKLIAVSKTRGPDEIEEAIRRGHQDFGENYAQELRDKVKTLSDPQIRWHYIGRIQRNKAKYIAPNAYRIHTLEHTDQVEALLKRAPHGLDGLLAVNIGREPQKSGLHPEVLLETAHKLAAMEKCRIHGLMCLPPAVSDPEEAAPYFEEMADWMDKGRADGLNWTELSMGMSADYPVAIRYGATWIRVGTAIFGARAKK